MASHFEKNSQGNGVWPEIEELEYGSGCRIYGNKTAWWNEEMSLAFLQYHFGQRRNRDEDKVMLTWDDFKGHFTPAIQARARLYNVVLEKIPPRFTWACQPADLAWNKPLKTFLRHRWVDHLRSQLENRAPGRFIFSPPSRADIIDWVTRAWEHLDSRIVINGFIKAMLIIPNGVQHPNPPQIDEDEDRMLDEAMDVINRYVDMGLFGGYVVNDDEDIFLL